MSGFLAQRLSTIKPSPTLAITAKAAQLKAEGKDIIGLGAGEPDFDTPDFIKAAAYTAIEKGATKYTQVEGTFALRKAISEKFRRDNEIDYPPENIIVSCGAKHVIFNALMATVNAGDEVIIPAPYWVSYPEMVSMFEGVSVLIKTRPEDNFCLSPEALAQAITPQTKWLILNSPNNPTGMTYTEGALMALAEVLRKHPHVWVLSDDIYEHIVYDGLKFKTFAQIAPDLKDRILTVNGVSKTYAMTGWRLGYGAGPVELIKAMIILQSQSTTNACAVSQAATVLALESPQDFLAEFRQIFKERRDFIVGNFQKISGLSCLMPQGAFYAYPSCARLIGKGTPAGQRIETDVDFAQYLLEAEGVAVVPGTAFGMSPYFRVSFATDLKSLKEAVQRIERACLALT